MPDTFTPYLNLCQPEVGGSIDTWGQKTNQDWTIVDTFAENAAGQIDAAFKAAEDAKADAAAVKGIADDANAKATKAESDAAAVKGIADDAKATAVRAESKADSANTTAGNAQTTANTANSTANTALQKANSAAQLNVANSWSANQTFPTAYATNFNFTNSPSSGLNLPSANEVAIYVQGQAAFVAQTDRTCRVGYNLVVGTQGLKPGGGAWGDSCDIRTKKNETIADFPLGLDAIKTLDVKEFQFNGKYGTVDNGRTYVGFIADDLLKTDFGPWCVFEYQWEDPETGKVDTIKAVDTTAILYAMVNGHKTLCQTTEVLQTEISPLQARVNDLEKQIVAMRA